MNKLRKQPSFKLNIGLLMILAIFMCSCDSKPNKSMAVKHEVSPLENEEQLISTMQKHLDAVSNKDLVALKTTMSPQGEMQLILPRSEIISSVDAFMDYHMEWFQDTTWTFETKILNTTVGERMGMAITEIVYREPERNGKPYFNRMTVSYDLEKIKGEWYIIKDHASTIEKTEN